MDNLHIIKKYFQLVNMKKRYTIYLIITSLLADGPYMFTSLLFSYAVKYLTSRQVDLVILTFIIYFSLKLISKVARIGNYQAEKKYYNESYRGLQEKIMTKVDSLEYDYFTNAKKSQLMNTVNVDIKELADFGAWISNSLLLTVSFLISIIILWRISFWLMLFGIIVNSAVIWILNYYNNHYEKIMFKAKQKTDQEIGFFSQIMNGMAEIKIFDLLPQFKKRYYSYNEAYLKEHNSVINNNIIKNIISPAITMTAEILLMIYAVYHCLKGTFGIETVLIIQSYFGNLFSSLSELVAALGDLRLKKVSIDRYAGFVEEKTSEREKSDKMMDRIEGNIRLKDVSFAYSNQPVISHLNLQFKPGKITGLVGASGS